MAYGNRNPSQPTAGPPIHFQWYYLIMTLYILYLPNNFTDIKGNENEHWRLLDWLLKNKWAICDLRDQSGFKLWVCLKVHRDLSWIIKQIFCHSLLEILAPSTNSGVVAISPTPSIRTHESLLSVCFFSLQWGFLKFMMAPGFGFKNTTLWFNQSARSKLGLMTHLKSLNVCAKCYFEKYEDFPEQLWKSNTSLNYL